MTCTSEFNTNCLLFLAMILSLERIGKLWTGLDSSKEIVACTTEGPFYFSRYGKPATLGNDLASKLDGFKHAYMNLVQCETSLPEDCFSLIGDLGSGSSTRNRVQGREKPCKT